MSMNIIMDAFMLGMIFAIMSYGVYLSFRVLNIPDLTIDGSFTTGCAASVVCCVAGYPWLGFVMAFLVGGLAGVITGFLQTKGKIQPLLAGILTMTGLYSINLKIMSGKPNISTFGFTTIFTPFEGITYGKGILLLLILIILSMLLYLFLKTQLGMSLRATGDNEAMVRASSINSDLMKMLGIALANAIVALAGGIFAQYQNFADVSGGIGMMVVGLASIIVGEAFFRKRTLLSNFFAVVVGAIAYRFLLTFALQMGIASTDMKLVSATLVALAISLPHVYKRRKYHA